MISGISGSLLSLDALERVLPDALRGLLDENGREAARRRVRSWHQPLQLQLGPATGARSLFDRLAVPLMAQLGYHVLPIRGTGTTFRAVLEADGMAVAVLLVTSWGADLASAWREAVTHGIGYGLRWCLCLSGPALRVADSRRTYSRRFVEFDLQIAFDDPRSFSVFWGLLRAPGMHGTTGDERSLLDRAVILSEQHRTAVRNSLQHGVQEALQHLERAFVAARRPRRSKRSSTAASVEGRNSDESLIIIYRILFLLFAEARGLVPRWHPVYRASYTIESLRGAIEVRPRPRGLWEALQAIARLAHRGCGAGSLRVPPFNGRLFSPTAAPLADTLPLNDGDVRQALLALTTRRGSSGRERIAYGDLGVEQLGGVYERLLDLEIAHENAASAPTLVRSERRKATGTFYTPRSLTEYLVRRTLAPLVGDASSTGILALRVLDPAMGSGAFLVAACRYLAGAYELALQREGVLSSWDIGEADRSGFRRLIAQRCLFGVDINPMAVQLGRLSLWLATLAADRPLTFLDHHLRAGNSLVGASPADVARQPPPGHAARVRRAHLPLLEETLEGMLRSAIGVRTGIATEPGDTLDQVRAKERALERLNQSDSPLACWKQLLDLWCSGWFRKPAGRSALRTSFATLGDAVMRGTSALPAHVQAEMLKQAAEIAARERFFHWSLEFPEVFYDRNGQPVKTSGFDAVIGNPPWEMLRGDRGDEDLRRAGRVAAAQLSDFARSAGIYTHQGNGHSNLYQLFLERALTLVRDGGRIGMVLPSGFATDHGCARLRHALLDRMSIDTFSGLENRDGVFPIHRGLRFLLTTATAGGRTSTVPCRFGVRRPESLDELADIGIDRETVPVSRTLLERLSGSQLAIPEIRSRQDLAIVTTIAFTIPALEDRDGWHVSFSRELNITEDRHHFTSDSDGVPVVEGKHVHPFEVELSAVRYYVPDAIVTTLARVKATYRRARVAYRDVASATNRLTLIAAIIPAGVLTAHTLFCLNEDLDDPAQFYLCGIFNSFVANYLVRLRVSTHVTASIVGRLAVPKPARDAPAFREISDLARRLTAPPCDANAAARLQALVARSYGLSRDQLRHVLDTFPLVALDERAAVMSAFCDIVS
jgi:Eco57I restriction-modification methylase